ncbi:hypothetical protein PanWU01x14_091110, partial [Parasponia andersonii]
RASRDRRVEEVSTFFLSFFLVSRFYGRSLLLSRVRHDNAMKQRSDSVRPFLSCYREFGKYRRPVSNQDRT